MFRRTEGILGDSGDHSAKGAELAALDADLIITTVVLGFVAGRLSARHPVEFHAQDGSDRERLDQAAQLINKALGADFSYGGEVTTGRTPDWEVGAMITGAVDAAATPFAQRHARIVGEAAKELHEIASTDPNVGYQGWGAYTGFVDDPIGRRGSIKSTVRFNVPESAGDRWVPPGYEYRDGEGNVTGDQDTLPWGLIMGERELPGGMVQQKFDDTVRLVGYTHGMIQAIYDAAATGPWCTPFEIAVGKNTTKMASCLYCTLYMYAAGYPPTAIHLGRGESWIPFFPADPGSAGYSPVVDEVIGSINTRWQVECARHLLLGLEILSAPVGTDMVAPTHRRRLPLLETYLDSRPRPSSAANLILDATTVHGHDVDRLLRTFGAA